MTVGFHALDEQTYERSPRRISKYATEKTSSVKIMDQPFRCSSDGIPQQVDSRHLCYSRGYRVLPAPFTRTKYVILLTREKYLGS